MMRKMTAVIVITVQMLRTIFCLASRFIIFSFKIFPSLLQIEYNGYRHTVPYAPLVSRVAKLNTALYLVYQGEEVNGSNRTHD